MPSNETTISGGSIAEIVTNEDDSEDVNLWNPNEVKDLQSRMDDNDIRLIAIDDYLDRGSLRGVRELLENKNSLFPGH